jgi:hypothetical protein
MKTLPLFIKKLIPVASINLFFNPCLMPLILALITLSSCSNDDDDVNVDVAKAIGTYTVVDTYLDDQIKNYEITISKGKDGGLEISNFGKIMYVPVKASIKGNVFTIPSQTFKSTNMTIIISGLGSADGNSLDFDYTIETGGDPLEHSCVASKKVN